MPARKKTSKAKRKKPALKQQNQPQLQFLGVNEDHADTANVPTTSSSRHCEEVDFDDYDVIENSQPSVKHRVSYRSLASDMDNQLKEAGMFEDGMTDSQKEDILKIIMESRKMAEENLSFDANSSASDDLFSNQGPLHKESSYVCKKKFAAINQNEKMDIHKLSDSDDDFVVPRFSQRKEKIKPKNIFTTFAMEKVQESVKRIKKSEKMTGESLQSRDGIKAMVDTTEANAAECKKASTSKIRPVLLRPILSSRRQHEKSRESPFVNHIPLYAPSDMAARTYTQVIRGYFDNYLENLSQVDQSLPRMVSWDNPVVVGRHNRDTIDALRPGHRTRDLETWYQTATGGYGFDADNSETSPKKPRMDSESEIPMTIDDNESEKGDGSNNNESDDNGIVDGDDDDTDNEDDDVYNDDDNLKSYLNEDDAELLFKSEKSQKNYERKKVNSEERIYINVFPDDVEKDPLDVISINNLRKSKERNNHKNKQCQTGEEETLDSNQSSQSFVKKFMEFTRKENNSSLISVLFEKAMPWKNRIAKQDDKNIQQKIETSNNSTCQKMFNSDEIKDHTCKMMDPKNDSTCHDQTAWCYMCKRVIAGVTMQCGRHSNINTSNEQQKE